MLAEPLLESILRSRSANTPLALPNTAIRKNVEEMNHGGWFMRRKSAGYPGSDRQRSQRRTEVVDARYEVFRRARQSY